MLSKEESNFLEKVNELFGKQMNASRTAELIAIFAYGYSIKNEKCISKDLSAEAKNYLPDSFVYLCENQMQNLIESNEIYEENIRNICEYYAYERKNTRWEDMRSLTSPQIAQLVCMLLDITPEDFVFDPCSGAGCFLNEAAKYSNCKYGANPKLEGIEIDRDASFVSKVILELSHNNANILEEDSLKAKYPVFNKGYVESPFGMRIISDRSASMDDNKIFISNHESEWLFIVKMLENIKKGGRFASLVPAGRLVSSIGIKTREYLVRNNLIEGIIELPSGMVPGTAVKTDLLIFNNSREEGTPIKMLDGNQYLSEKSNRRFDSLQLNFNEFVKAYYSDTYFISPEEIMNNEFKLSPTYYLSSADKISVPYPKKVSEIATVMLGSQYTIAHFKSSITEENSGYRILTSSDIQEGLIEFEELTRIEPDKKLEKFAIKKGDIVMTSKSSKVKTAVIDEMPDEFIIVTGGMIIIRPDLSSVNPFFLKMFFDSEMGVETLKKIQRGVTIITITASSLEKAVVSCPPLEEQNKIAAKYSSLVNMYAGLQDQTKKIKEKIDHFYSDYLSEEE